MPFLSIIIPVYNKGQYLNKCIQSIVEQSFTDWEVILVDDGSSDSSSAICDQWSEQDARIKVIHQKNAGVSTARNEGMKLARGEYMQFTDADDWWGVDAFQTLCDSIKESQADIHIFGLTKVDQEKREQTCVPERIGNFTQHEFLSTLIQEQYHSGVYGSVANKIFKRSIIELHHITFNASYNLLEDYDFFLSLFEVIQKVSLSSYAGYFYQQNAENSTTSKGFSFLYTDVARIHVKAYRLVDRICGFSKTNQQLVRQRIEWLYMGAIVEMGRPDFRKLNTLQQEFAAIASKDFTISPAGTTRNTKIISFLLKIGNFRFLSIYLNLRKLISHA